MQGNPIEQLVPRRARHLLARTGELIWEDGRPVEVYGGPINDPPVDLEAAREQSMNPVEPGERFGRPHGGWQQRWLRIDIPACREGEQGRRALHFDCDGETTVWIEGRPWSGLDIGHRYCVLPDRACTLWLDCGTYATGVWIPNSRKIGPFGCQFFNAEIRLRNEQAWRAYHDIEALVALMDMLLDEAGLSVPEGAGYVQPFERAPVLLRKLLVRLDGAADAFDKSGLAKLLRHTRATYRQLRRSPHTGLASLVGHAHLDLVWLWPEMVTYRKAVHTCATVLRLMERYPEFRFTQSQPALYEAIGETAPGLFGEIRARIEQKRWEATGAMEVESDVNLPSGEGLARSFLYGQLRFKELRGSYSRNLWLPDAFGYSACVPQLCVLAGVDSFFTTKLTWSAVTRFPYTSFRWRSPDGSEVLAHLAASGYHGAAELRELAEPHLANRQAGLVDELLLPTGFGDGGGGPNEAMCERARRYEDLAGAPRTSWTRVEDFFDRLDRVRGQLPIYEGELYLEYHRGTYTTQARLKLAYRTAEKALLAHEAVRVVTGQPALPREAWLRTVFAQFHDAIPGSSISRVNEEINAELESIVEREREAAARALAGRSRNFGIFNPIALERMVTVELPDGAWATERGDAVLVQEIGRGKHGTQLARVRCAGLSAACLHRVDDADVTDGRMVADSKRLDNGIVDARFDARGRLRRLHVHGKDSGVRSSDLMIYPDHPSDFDAWDIDRGALGLAQRALGQMDLALVENGPVRATLSGSAAIGEASEITVSYIVQAGSDVLEVEMAIDWAENHKLLKYHLVTDRRGRDVIYGGPFGAVHRTQIHGDHADTAMWEVPGQRWVAVVDDANRGVAIITESKYGFSCLNGNLGLSLLRAPAWPDAGADRHFHTIRFAVGAHRSTSDETGLSTAAQAESLYGEVVSAVGIRTMDSPLTLHGLGGVVPAATKPCEDGRGFILRLHETAGANGTFLVAFSEKPDSISKVDILERPFKRGKVAMTGNRAKIGYDPYEIISLCIR